MDLSQLKQFNPDNGSIETMVEMLAYGTMILREYDVLKEIGIETPDWLAPKLRKIRREVEERHEDLLRKRLADAKLRLERYKTPTEKREETVKEIEILTAKLGGQV